MKILLIPLAIAAFVVFLLVLGAVGLGVATLAITVVGKLFAGVRWLLGLFSRGGRRLRSRRPRKQTPGSASAD